MGRGRGRGKKLAIVRSHEDKGSSGEEVVPARKRRGRPQKRFAEKIEQTDVENFVEKVDGDEEEIDDVKMKNSTSSVGNKRGRPLKEGSNLVLEEIALTFDQATMNQRGLMDSGRLEAGGKTSPGEQRRQG